MLRIDLAPEAERDIQSIFAWYEQQRPGLGLAFLLATEVAIDGIRRLPEARPLLARNTRRVMLRRFPYALFYTREGSCVLVTGILHGHRNPESWSDRVRDFAASAYFA